METWGGVQLPWSNARDFSRVRRRASAQARRAMRGHRDAVDVADDAIVAVLAALERGADIRDFDRYLSVTVRNRCANRLQQVRRTLPVGDPGEVAGLGARQGLHSAQQLLPGTDRHVELVDLRQRLARLLDDADLSPLGRTLFVRRHVAGQTIDDLVDACGQSLQVVVAELADAEVRVFLGLGLNPEQARCGQLRLLHGLSGRDTGDLLGLTAQEVADRMVVVRRRIRERYS